MAIKLPQAAHDVGRILRSRVDGLQIAGHLLLVVQALRDHQQEFAEPQNRRQGVVEVVGDAAGHLPQGPQALLLDDLLLRLLKRGQRLLKTAVALPERLLRPLALRDIVGQHQPRIPPAEKDLVGGDFDVDESPVFLAMSPDAGPFERRSGPRQVLHEGGDILRGTNVFDGHPQELLSRVSVVIHGGIVDGQKDEGLKVIDEHGVRVVLEQRPVPRLAGDRRLGQILTLPWKVRITHASNTSRTLRARASGVKGFCKKWMSPSSASRRRTASSV